MLPDTCDPQLSAIVKDDIGKLHAINLYDLTQRALVVAASTPCAKERRWVQRNLENVTIYADFDQMLEQESLHAVVIASNTFVRAEQAMKVIARGYHVLCQEPPTSDPSVVGISCGH